MHRSGVLHVLSFTVELRVLVEMVGGEQARVVARIGSLQVLKGCGIVEISRRDRAEGVPVRGVECQGRARPRDELAIGGAVVEQTLEGVAGLDERAGAVVAAGPGHLLLVVVGAVGLDMTVIVLKAVSPHE